MAIAAPSRVTRHARLKRSPLALVISQVRFPPVFKVMDQDFISPVQEAIRDKYPVVGQEHEIQMILGPQGVQQSPGQKQWRFMSVDGMWSIVLGQTAVTLEARSYTDASEYFERFAEVLNVVRTHVRPSLVERLGLRYVNEFRQPQCDSAQSWHGLIDGGFLGPLDGELGKRFRVSRTIQDITLEKGPGELVSLKHGFIPDGTTVTAIPSPDARMPAVGPFYLLDIDHFSLRRHPFEIDGMMETLDKFHSVIYDLFRLAITPDLYERLEPARG